MSLEGGVNRGKATEGDCKGRTLGITRTILTLFRFRNTERFTIDPLTSPFDPGLYVVRTYRTETVAI